MAWFQRELQLPEYARGVHPITHIVLDAVPEISEIRMGLFHVFLKHTSAFLSINENAEPDEPGDMERLRDTLAAHNVSYRHATEGPNDMPGHAKSALLGCSLMVPISDGRLCLGALQEICLCERRRRAGRRHLVVTIEGETRSPPPTVIHLPASQVPRAEDAKETR